MEPCAKPVSEQTVSDIAGCGWKLIKDAALAVADHPGGANLTEWMLIVLLALVVLFMLGSLLRR